MYSKSLEMGDEVTPQVACSFSLELFKMKPAYPMYVL